MLTSDFLGSLIFVPMYRKIGRRPVMLISLVLVMPLYALSKQ